MPRMRNALLTLAVTASSFALIAQTTPPQAARNYTSPRQSELTQQFSDFLSIPNVAGDFDFAPNYGWGNLHLQNLWDGIETMAALLAMP